MRDWILSHDMEHTTTAADESAGNGRVESEIAHLKHHTKLLLTTARAPPTYWPMALRHASEYRLRKTLGATGSAGSTAHFLSERKPLRNRSSGIAL